MGFAEALSDDGVLSGRGRPWMRGGVCGAMTTLGGIAHTLPFLLPDFYLATWVAVAVVAIELGAIAWIIKRKRYMETPLLQAIFQVVLGGILRLWSPRPWSSIEIHSPAAPLLKECIRRRRSFFHRSRVSPTIRWE